MRKFFRRRSREWVVNSQGIKRVDSGRVTQHLSWTELSEVAIRTHRAGPVKQDFYWILKRHGREAMVVPGQEARKSGLPERLQMLPGFDTETAIEATTAKHDQTFVCWRVNGDG